MWDDFEPEEIVGRDRIVDKLKLVRAFLDTKHEVSLSDPEKLSGWLKGLFKGTNRIGVYCVYDSRKKKVFYVGKSKRLKERLREQLIGVKDRKTSLRKFTRLFPAVLKVKKGMMEKEYEQLPPTEKREFIEFYQSTIFKTNNLLRVCFLDSHIEAIVLEDTLITYFKEKNQCKYNSLV